uniref:Synergin, gamma n=1 Tax=Kryptolebias marmoratus TaxID=37003 RepID=A0A3Q3BLT7_KRYMA
MALRPGSGGGSFIYSVGGGLGPSQMVPMQQQQQQPQPQQGFPMVPVMQPNMQGMMGMNFGGQMPPGAIPIQQGGMAIGMQTPGMQFMGQPQFMGMRPAGPQYTADMQKQMAEEHKRLEQQQKMLEEDRKRRQFEEQKQKLRLLSSTEAASEGSQSETSEEFGAFQGDKPKFGKSDFLKASAQTKVKSSEEMIKNELATFDLSVQSHKRSHSLGEKEIGRSPPSPAPEQPFRDRSNTLNEKPSLPVIRDKYKDLTGEVEESERYAYEWQRCLESALEVITKANNTLNGISSSSVCTEVIQSAQGMEYLLVVEVYRVTRRVELGIKATAVCSEKLQQLLKDVSRVWNNLIGFMSLAKLPDESSLDFSSCILRPGIKNPKELACGVCLLNVDARSKAFNSETDNFKLLYGGHQYHASCANFWINCVEPKPPGLILPDLL